MCNLIKFRMFQFSVPNLRYLNTQVNKEKPKNEHSPEEQSLNGTEPCTTLISRGFPEVCCPSSWIMNVKVSMYIGFANSTVELWSD